MGLFNLFTKKQENPENIDYLSIAENFEKKGDFASAIGEYEKMMSVFYKDKPEAKYRHIIKKIVSCHNKLGNYEKVFEMWPSQYDSSDYGAKEMYELIKILESAQKLDLVMKVYNQAGKSLARNKIEFLIKQKKIPEANLLLSELLVSIPESNPAVKDLWMLKAKLCMGLLKWEEANKYLNKIIERDTHNMDARKLKDFCLKQVKNS